MQDARTKSPGSSGHGELPEVDDRRTSPERRGSAGDRRVAPRRKTLKTGRTYWPNGDSSECGIRNVSETGAQLEVRGPIPNAFDLVIGGDPLRLSCSVVWRQMGRLGVRFADPHRPSRASENLVGRTAEFRQYADICRTLARGADALTREVLLKMAAAWEMYARRPRKRANVS